MRGVGISILGVVVKAMCLLQLVAQASAQQQLEKYNIDKSKITVSGISSGGIMAIQYHFAHSSEVLGAGVFATVPYMCGFGGVAASLTCMSTPNLVNNQLLIAEAQILEAQGNIDSTNNVVDSPVYIFHGSKDSVVRPASGENVRTVYQHFGANIKTEFTVPAGHGQPTDDYGGPCDSLNNEYINNCNYDGAYEMLNYLYGGNLKRPLTNDTASGDFLLIDQSEFFDFAPSLSSMDNAGFLYIPTGCKDKATPCALHIAFHGCTQQRDVVGDSYATKTGYLETAELNNIVVLFPQTVANILVGNPQGCWDWWGYLTNLFATKHGNQILATYRMMNRIVNG